MKKMFALILAIVMVMGLATTAFAAEEIETGSITINGAHTEYTYEIYKILDLYSFNKNPDSESYGAYSYKVNETWKDFFATEYCQKYFAVNDADYVSLVEGNTLAADIAAFAQEALKWAKDHNITPEKSTKNEGDYTTGTTNDVDYIKFSNLPLGYYLIDSDVGALCGLTTTDKDASVLAKNNPPTQEKQVQEDSTGYWGDENTADIGQTVNFRATIQVHTGAQNYIFHDYMEEGLTFDASSVKVELVEPGAAGTGTTTIALEAGTDYVLNTADDLTCSTKTGDSCSVCGTEHEGCTFEIAFTNAGIAKFNTNDKIIIYYSAVLNENAKISDANVNKSRLEYGEGYCSGWDDTKTYTYSIDIVKTNGVNTLIDGAKFEIYDVAEDGTALTFVKLEDGSYRRATADDEETVTEIEVKNGKVTVSGFDNGTYYLEETVAPVGYNKLSSRQSFTISGKNLSAYFSEEGVYTTGSGVWVVNQSGTMLPETGGMGTTLFYVFGVVLVAAAGILLVTKKRMTAEN